MILSFIARSLLFAQRKQQREDPSVAIAEESTASPAQRLPKSAFSMSSLDPRAGSADRIHFGQQAEEAR